MIPVRPPRDRRLDILRGWMQVSIFVSHVAGTGFAWLIHAAWGLSDSSEQFVFLSGFGLGSVFTLKEARDGFAAGLRDLSRRLRRLYLVHLLVVALLGAMIFSAQAVLSLPEEALRSGWAWLAEAPLAATTGILLMLYQPAFTGILPVFVWCMLALPLFMAATARWGACALLPPALLWAGVQVFGWEVRGLGGTQVEFNPLAWQLLFLLGAWCGRRALLGGAAPARTHSHATALALVVVLAAAGMRAVGHLGLDSWQFATALLDGKEHLALPRLLHALALAWLVAAFVPRQARWMESSAAEALATVGRHSLGVFCLGLFLSWLASTALRLHPGAHATLDPLLILGGTAILLGFARIANGRAGVPALPRSGARMHQAG